MGVAQGVPGGGRLTPTAALQVGQSGEAEEWRLVHQLANEPDARSMEVPNLSPYTYYRRVAGAAPCHPPRGGAGALSPPAVTPPLLPSQFPHAASEHRGHQPPQFALPEDPDPAGPPGRGTRQRHPADSQRDQPVAALDGEGGTLGCCALGVRCAWGLSWMGLGG